MTPTPERVRIRGAPPPPHLRAPHLGEDALYETAAWPCLEAALGTGCARVYRGGTECIPTQTTSRSRRAASATLTTPRSLWPSGSSRPRIPR